MGTSDTHFTKSYSILIWDLKELGPFSNGRVLIHLRSELTAPNWIVYYYFLAFVSNSHYILIRRILEYNDLVDVYHFIQAIVCLFAHLFVCFFVVVAAREHILGTIYRQNNARYMLHRQRDAF